MRSLFLFDAIYFWLWSVDNSWALFLKYPELIILFEELFLLLSIIILIWSIRFSFLIISFFTKLELLISFETSKLDNKDLIVKIALNYLAIQKNKLGFPMNDVCRFHLNNGAEIDDVVINANVSDVGFKRSFGVMVNYKYELSKIEQNHQEYVNDKKINLSSKLKKYV